MKTCRCWCAGSAFWKRDGGAVAARSASEIRRRPRTIAVGHRQAEVTLAEARALIAEADRRCAAVEVADRERASRRRLSIADAPPK